MKMPAIGKAEMRKRVAKPAAESREQVKRRLESCIAKAVKLLGHKASEAMVREAMLRVEVTKWHLSIFGPNPFMPTKAEKEAAKQLWSALARAEILLPRLRPYILLYDDELDPEKSLPGLGRLKLWAENFAEVPLGKPKRHSDPAKYEAVKQAAKLLKHYGHPIKGTRRSDFCSLSALLYGYEPASLYHHCSAFLRAHRRAGSGRN